MENIRSLIDNFKSTPNVITKDELEYRYKPRPGPIISPEPEIGDVMQSAEAFDIDPDGTLLMRTKANIEKPIENMQHHLSLEFHKIAHDVFASILSSKGKHKERQIGIAEFEEMMKKLLKAFLDTSNAYCKTSIVKEVVDLVDQSIVSARRSIVDERRKVAIKLTNARDACHEFRRTTELAMAHTKAEVIRITTNESEDRFREENKQLKDLYEAADYGNRILTKKVDFFTEEIRKKDAQIHDMQFKTDKALKREKTLTKEFKQYVHNAEQSMKEMKEYWGKKLEKALAKQEKPDDAEKTDTAEEVLKSKLVLCDSFTQTVDTVATTVENVEGNSSLVEEIEVLQEKIKQMKLEHEVEIEKFQSEIETLKEITKSFRKSLHELESQKQIAEDVDVERTGSQNASAKSDAASLEVLQELATRLDSRARAIEDVVEITSKRSVGVNTIVEEKAMTIESSSQTDPLPESISADTTADTVIPSITLDTTVKDAIASFHTSLNDLNEYGTGDSALQDEAVVPKGFMSIENRPSSPGESIHSVVVPDHAPSVCPTSDNSSADISEEITMFSQAVKEVEFNMPGGTEDVESTPLEVVAPVQLSVKNKEVDYQQVNKKDAYRDKFVRKSRGSQDISLDSHENDSRKSVIPSFTDEDYVPEHTSLTEATYPSADVAADDIQKKSKHAIEYSNLQKKYNELVRNSDFQKYVIFSLEEQCKQQSTQIESLEALMEQNELVSKLKLRERSILLMELSAHVNSLRGQVGKTEDHQLPRPMTVSQSLSTFPALTDELNPETIASPSNLKRLRDNQRSMPEISVARPATVSTRTHRDLQKKSAVVAEPSSSSTTLHNKPFSAPLYNLEKDRLAYKNIPVFPEVKSPEKQVNFLRAGHGSLNKEAKKRADMFVASAGTQGRVKAKSKEELSVHKEGSVESFYESKSDILVEDTGLSFSWLGLDEAKHDKILEARKEIVKSLTEAARLKKKHMMATTKAKELQGKGREVKLKLKADDFFLM